MLHDRAVDLVEPEEVLWTQDAVLGPSPVLHLVEGPEESTYLHGRPD